MSHAHKWHRSSEFTSQKKEDGRISGEMIRNFRTKFEDKEEIRQKVDELCKRYVPILPASNPANPAVCLYTVQELPENQIFLPDDGYSSYIFQYSDTSPQKFIPHADVTNIIDTVDSFEKDTVFLLCGESTKSEIECTFENHVKPVINCKIDKIDIASKVDPELHRNRINCRIDKFDIASKVDPELHRNRRKSRVRIEEPDDLVFTDNLEDLLDKNDLESNRKRKRTFVNRPV